MCPNLSGKLVAHFFGCVYKRMIDFNENMQVPVTYNDGGPLLALFFRLSAARAWKRSSQSCIVRSGARMTIPFTFSVVCSCFTCPAWALQITVVSVFRGPPSGYMAKTWLYFN